MKTKQAGARKRAELIMKVRCGLMTASDAAAELGVSRKTYYKWEKRGLAALLDGVSNHQSGRPQKPQHQSVLEKQLAEVERQNQRLRQKIRLKELMIDLDLNAGESRSKKK